MSTVTRSQYRGGVCATIRWWGIPPIGPGSSHAHIRAGLGYHATRGINFSGARMRWSGFVTGTQGPVPIQGPGGRRLKDVGAQVPLSYTEETRVALEYRLQGVPGTGGDLVVRAYLRLPKRPPQLPKTVKSLTVEQIRDGQHNLVWVNDAPNDPSTKYDGLLVQRQTDGGPWTTVATLRAVVDRWSDYSTLPNHSYRYRVQGYNRTGRGGAAVSGMLYTSPAAPKDVRARRFGAVGNKVTWVDQAPFDTALEAWARITKPGATQPESEWVKLADYIPEDVEEWIHTEAGAQPGVTYEYLLRCRANSGGKNPETVYSDWSPLSNPIVPLSAPHRPKIISPDGIVHSSAEELRLEWEYSAPDTTDQTHYNVQYRWKPRDGDQDSWSIWQSTGDISSGNHFHVVEGGWPAGQVYEWNVDVRGEHPDWSGWSELARFRVEEPPSATILTPADGATITGSSLLVRWETFSPVDSPQGKALVELRDAAGVLTLVSEDIKGQEKECWFTGLKDGREYTVAVRVYTLGMASEVETARVAVDYAEPAIPDATVTYDPEIGSALIVVSNPDVEPTPIRNEVWANGIHIGDTGNDGTLLDMVPDLQGTKYEIVAVTALPSVSRLTDLELELPATGRGIHLNAGPGFSLHAVMRAGGPSTSDEDSADVVLERFAGDALPSPTFGPGKPFKTSLDGWVYMTDPDSEPEAWRDVIRSQSTVCLRRADLKRFGVLTSLTIDRTSTMWGRISCEFVETATDDRDLLAGIPEIV